MQRGNAQHFEETYSDIEIEHRNVGSTSRTRTLKQPIFFRYLEPYVDQNAVRNIQLPQPPDPSPITIIQQGRDAAAPKPLVYREIPKPPQNIIYIHKPSTPPRSIVIENMSHGTPPPPPILIERWLPPRYPPKIVEREKPSVKQKRKVIIVQRSRPKVKVIKEYYNLGTKRVDQSEYARMLENISKKATIKGKSIFIESRLSWDEFKKETGYKQASGGYSDDIIHISNVTVLGEGQLRI
ncbi:hypothetical protein GJ496_002672 [Pomphorhynchus laevis]|nr:hypothetical protein GJ496_002672 [Pomphorhynchus laevis]